MIALSGAMSQGLETAGKDSGKGLCITKTRLHVYSLTPLKHHFYTVKLGFTVVYIDFLISAKKHRLWVLVAGLGGSFRCAVRLEIMVAGSNPAKVGNILPWRLIMKYFLWSFSPFG